MQEVIKSLEMVMSASFFTTWISIVFGAGIFLGWWYDQRIAGFRKSLILILPHTLLILLATMSRIYETSQMALIGANAYNGMITWTLFTIVYVLGLFIGHMTDRKGRKKAQEAHDQLKGAQL